jgi:hypothetical protein
VLEIAGHRWHLLVCTKCGGAVLNERNTPVPTLNSGFLISFECRSINFTMFTKSGCSTVCADLEPRSADVDTDEHCYNLSFRMKVVCTVRLP